jgi:adenylyltransferase/sulfurtransferase
MDLTKTLVVFCQTGVRSLKAVELLNKRNIMDCYSLKEGIYTLIEELKIKA